MQYVEFWLPYMKSRKLLISIPVCVSRSVASNSLQLHGLQTIRLLCPWDSPGKNSGVGCHFLLQGIFPIQELNPGLLHCRQIPYHLSPQGSAIPVDKAIYLNLRVVLLMNLILKQILKQTVNKTQSRNHNNYVAILGLSVLMLLIL